MNRASDTNDELPAPRLRPGTALHCLLLLAVAVALRGWHLDHLPGLNGDEAWMGVQAQRFLDGGYLGMSGATETGGGAQVAWQTPTGNPINWFLFWPTVLLHAWLPPSIGLLRLPALLSGLLALAVNYWLCRRLWGVRLASLSTVLLAVMPINIAYSRFGWDACQSLLLTLPVVYGSLLAVAEPQRRRVWLLWAAAAQAASILVHPTNIFTAPLLLVAVAWCYRVELRSWSCQVRDGRYLRLALTAGSLLLAIATWLLWPWCMIAARRIITPGELGAFLVGWLDLFSGQTVYGFIPGYFASAAEPTTLLYRLVAAVVVALALWGAYRRYRESHDRTIDILLWGSLASVVGFFLVAGPEALRPHFERYGICLIASGALVLSLGVEWWLTRYQRRQAVAAHVSAAAVAWLLLGSFGLCYLGHMQQTGGESHPAFRTAAEEPKVAAWALLQETSRGATTSLESTEPLLVVADDWWTYWPLVYLNGDNDRITIWNREQLSSDWSDWSDVRKLASPRSVAWIGFSDSPRRSRWMKQLEARGYKVEEWQVSDYADCPTISIIRGRR